MVKNTFSAKTYYSRKPMSEINVTPFVDVMLVLLIIFMVTTPLMERGIEVQLPEEKAESVNLEEGFVITIKKDGVIYLDKEMIPMSTMGPKLKEIFSGKKYKEIYLRADKANSYGYVMKVMAAVKEAGISKVGLVTEYIE